MSEALRDSFEDPTTVVHPGKHYLPAAAPQKHEYQKFFKTCLLRKQHESNVNNMKSNLSVT